MGLSELSPLWNNIIISLLTVIYTKIGLQIATRLRERHGKGNDSRKLIHFFNSSWLLFWPLFDVTHWSWRLNTLVPVVLALKLFHSGAILADPEDPFVRVVSRSSSPSELLYGPIQFSAIMTWVGLTKFMTEEAAVIMAAVGIGDSLASVIGSRYGRHVYQMPFSNMKTIEGSMFVFLGTVGGCYLYPYGMGLQVQPLRLILAYSGVASMVEGCTPGSIDNVVMTVVLHFLSGPLKQALEVP
mmetsp:Transcript_22185/g.44886  ORF Transcript_22185/g.44886 Transcript_22185/m.44886 type:complete len:242 (-) Transcript_22185:3-728(-)